jgi:hypothetical protein
MLLPETASVILVAVARAGDHDVKVSATMREGGRPGALPPGAARVTALLARPCATAMVLRLVRVCFALPAVIAMAVHPLIVSEMRAEEFDVGGG